jgi:NADH-quinone oxidoreductase subunit G
MLAEPLRAYLTVGPIEAGDFADPALAHRAFAGAACVVALTPFVTDELRAQAHVLLPIATFAETSGTFVNLEGRFQSFTAAAKAPGETRPGWKVLRVLGNAVDAVGFDYQSSEDVRVELEQALVAAGIAAQFATSHGVAAAGSSATTDDVPMYAVDALVRRSPALQATVIARQGAQGAA